MTSILLRTRSILVLGILALAACGGSDAPRSTTTTHSETVTENEDGEATRSDVTEKTTEHQDGSTTVERKETSEEKSPPSHPE
jgi:ABC-type phosphate transport system substrate-binding protein